MAKLPKNCPKEIAPLIQSGIQLCDVTFHNNINPWGDEPWGGAMTPEQRFHSKSQKNARQCNIWFTSAGYFLEKSGAWRHIPEAHGKIGTPVIEKAPKVSDEKE